MCESRPQRTLGDGREMARRVIVMMGVGFVVLVAVFAVWFVSKPEVDIDERATHLQGKLGSLCDNFDFQLKEENPEGTVRPINCNGPSAPEADLRLFVFSDGDTLDEWREGLLVRESSVRGSEHVAFGDDWAIKAFGSKIVNEAERRLKG